MASSSTSRQEEEVGNAFDEIAPHASSLLTEKMPYDVCINHYAVDIKNTLASTIYHTLDLLGVRVFFDNKTLKLGDVMPAKIQQAMRSASLHIAIFSRNYAESPWCLDELSFMLKTGTKIIPVFYNVQPYDLRWLMQGKGIYADSFFKHEQKGRFTSEKLLEWKKALHNVSFMIGIKISNDRDEGRALKDIVNCILKQLNKSPLEVAKHPVGLDEVVHDFEKSIIQSTERLQNIGIVGIVGMGGCGKTTLAKELYNRKCFSFDGSSFVSEVRIVSNNNLYKLQRKLLKDLVGDVKGLTFDNVDEGKESLEYHLRLRRVLIVLDDIDHMDQLEALMAAKDSLGPGSLIIITSRDMGILTRFGISSIYKMKGLNRRFAEQFFSWHAFNQPYPLTGFKGLVEKFLMACNNLPLTLKVLGRLLHGKSKDYWEVQLQKISELVPEDVKQRLKLSYDALDKESQEIFLDIACFFIGEKISSTISIWDQSGWNGQDSLETLVDKSLVEIDHHNRIRMHSQLRDLGRHIASQSFPCRFSSTLRIEKPGELYGKSKDQLEYELDKLSVILIDKKKFQRFL